ncbi:MAG: PHP domain-containing protein [Chloroflexi bacterium]|nr:MAG: PHP domain-containing protein [Chloroflexota bacterium]
MTEKTQTLLAPDAAVDLHLHTFASDGRWTHEALVDYLTERQFTVAAIADHDTMHSVPGVTQLARERGITIVPAVEMTTRWNGRQVHLLVYGVDVADPRSEPFRKVLQRQQDQLAETAERMLGLLARHARHTPSLREIAGDLPLTPHRVFSAMIRDGHANGLQQAHNILRSMGEPVVVDVPLDETVDAAHAARALTIVAHPGRDEGAGILDAAKLDELYAEIPIDGVEAHYRSYKDADVQRYRAWAEQNGLLVSAGSDSHWPSFPVNPTPHPARWIAGLLARLGQPVAPWEGPAWEPDPPGAASDAPPDAS